MSVSVPAPTRIEPSLSTGLVRIFAPDREYEEIAASLRYSEFEAQSADADGSAPIRSDRPAAAVIVSDAMPTPLELCRASALHHPVVLLSSESDFGFRLSASRAGIKAIVKRPVDPIDLVDCLRAVTEAEVSGSLSVVLVDDDKLSADLNADILRAAGLDVEVVDDPFRAVETIERVKPDLILMDVRMPGVDGVEVAQVIRLSREFVSTPIVFLSVERDEDRQSAARRLGGDDFIQKPIDPRKLITQVKLRAGRAKVLRSIIEKDGLTGLLDRSRFHDRLAQEIESRRHTGGALTLAMIDIDRFKAVNDRYGHPAGDQVIRTLAQILTSSLRQRDVIGRCGGEEFGVILLDADDSSAHQVIERIRTRLGDMVFRAGSVDFNVTLSAGIASTRDFPAQTDLLSAADRALYTGKAEGRNKVRVAVSESDGARRTSPRAEAFDS